MLAWVRHSHWDMQLWLECMINSALCPATSIYVGMSEAGPLGYTAVATVHDKVCLHFAQLLAHSQEDQEHLAHSAMMSKHFLHAVLLHIVTIGANKFAHICRRRCAIHAVQTSSDLFTPSSKSCELQSMDRKRWRTTAHCNPTAWSSVHNGLLVLTAGRNNF